jgi:23S rRNA (cytosine1962-C5)-methyltransferase
VEGNPNDGDEVEVVSHAGHFVARGLFNSQSKIRVRLYSWTPDTPLDKNFFRDRMARAVRLRHAILSLDAPARAYRVVFSESDGLSGCTVDRYDRWLVVQFTSLGLAQRRETLADILEELLKPEGIFLRTERGIGHMEGVDLQDGLLRGHVPSEPVTIEETGVRFLVSIAEGQKTGFYLDQRENRAAVAGKSVGRRMLDAFCYTGGFGLHAARAGAAGVLGIDVSGPALTLGRENARTNGLDNVGFVRADVFQQMNDLVRAGERFGIVVLDPPKFARARPAVDDALNGYRRLQKLALGMLEQDGILVTCCCSGLITLDMLETLHAQVAAEEHRDIQILERRGQGADHPVAVTCPETSYLKCIISRVD